MIIRNFRFILPEKLAGMGHPGFRDQLPDTLAILRKKGIKAIVSLDEEGLPDDLLAEHNVAYRHFPIADFCAPTIEQAKAFCHFVDQENARGRAVAAHCWAGIGRTGTMLACYLIYQGTSSTEAIRKVRATGGIESPEQEKFLYEFETACCNKKNASDR